ncbi:uncharacterized protein F5891DRAFT_977333 [Suillus fuscotomentosus]|uniref:Uncharacterized protein n=1 Tax=Suillus fuscotomentosus TaxID=1912939 RepID=A0AAD4HN24_9AGAM|nr:uncharacterized protein F5891DRAFT_977333 [Suillus fuscotomentosus]KAG1903765.1 hypothetical protein F5891DRAFT_977333 [Suillus fuscotomentosus]
MYPGRRPQRFDIYLEVINVPQGIRAREAKTSAVGNLCINTDIPQKLTDLIYMYTNARLAPRKQYFYMRFDDDQDRSKFDRLGPSDIPFAYLSIGNLRPATTLVRIHEQPEQSHATASSLRLDFINACLACQTAALELVKFDDAQHEVIDGRFVNNYRQYLRFTHLDATGQATSTPSNPFYTSPNGDRETQSEAVTQLKALRLTRSWLNAHVDVFNFILQSFDLEIGRLRSMIVDGPTC